MSEEKTKTEPSPPPTSAESGEWAAFGKQMAPEQFQAEVMRQLGSIQRRLDDGDRTFRVVDADWFIAMNFMRELSLERGNEERAQRIQREIDAKRQNGSGKNDDEPTDPGLRQ